MSMPTFGSLMYGFMSIHAPDWQNLPTLSTPKESTVSGASPALIAAMIFWSVNPVLLSTVIHGYCFSNPSKILLKTFVSLFDVHSLHIESVTGACEALGLTVWTPLLPPPPPHAAANNPRPMSIADHRFMLPPPPPGVTRVVAASRLYVRPGLE